MAGITVCRRASDAKDPAASRLADDLPPGLNSAQSSAGARDMASVFKRLPVQALAAGLRPTACTPATRLDTLHKLAAELSPPEDQPTDVLEKGSACLIALAMREVDPEKLGAAAAVPLVIAMLHYELASNDTDETAMILGACFPHALAVTAWTRTVRLKMHLGLPQLSHLRTLHAAARLCKEVADFLNLSKDERRANKHLNAVKRLPQAEALGFDAACLAACASDIARRLLGAELPMVLGTKHFHLLLNAAVVAALISLHALRRARHAAGRFPRGAAAPTADTICNLLPVVPHGVDTAFLQELSDTASLLTEVVGSITHKQAAQLETEVTAAAALTLTTSGLAEAAEAKQSGPPGVGFAQLELTSEGQQQQQLVAEASAPELQHLMSLSLAVSHVVATTQLLAAVSRSRLPCRERTHLLARLLRWAVDMQRLHQPLLGQQPQHSFESSHWHNGATRNELLSDQVLSVADAAAHGLAAAVLMGVSAGIWRRCQAMAAAGSSRGGKGLPPCAPDAQLAAALPAICTLVKAQAECKWGDEPTDGAWQSAHALVTLAGHLADVLADTDRTAAGSSAAPATIQAAAAATAADSPSAGPAGGGCSSPDDVEPQAAWRAYTAAAGQPSLDELVGTAVAGAGAVAGWATDVLKRVQRIGVYAKRLEKMAAELRPARLAAAAVGVLRDLAGSDAGRAALLRQRQRVVTCVLASLEAALPLKAMHQGPAATAELAALVHGVAGLLGLLLTPDAPPAAEAQSSIDSWRVFAADVQKRPHSAFPRELLRAVISVTKALQGACRKPGGGGAAAAGQTDAEAAADAVAAALIQDEDNAAAAAPGQQTRQHKGRKGRGGGKK